MFSGSQDVHWQELRLHPTIVACRVGTSLERYNVFLVKMRAAEI